MQFGYTPSSGNKSRQVPFELLQAVRPRLGGDDGEAAASSLARLSVPDLEHRQERGGDAAAVRQPQEVSGCQLERLLDDGFRAQRLGGPDHGSLSPSRGGTHDLLCCHRP